MTITKAQIVEALFARNIFTSGFGKFSVKEKYERNGRNPQTGEPAMLAARKLVTLA